MKAAVLVGISILLTSYSMPMHADLISEMASQLNRHHISAPAESAAVEGLRRSVTDYLHSLDPYTEYLPPQRYRQRRKSGSFGIGADILSIDDYYIIIPYRNGAAFATGLQVPSRLLAVFGQAVTPLPFADVAKLFATTLADETIIIAIQRPRVAKAEMFSIRPRRVQAPLVERFDVAGRSLLRVREFRAHQTSDLINREIQKRRSEQQPLIIDLRFAQGGDFYEALDTASLFLPTGALMGFSVDNSNRRKAFRALPNKQPILHAEPIILLIGPHTASAAESFTAALHFHGAAILVGQQTYGKCTGQKLFELSNGGALKITNLKLLWPSGHFCNNNGLEPDYRVSALAILDTELLIDYGLQRIWNRLP